MELPRGENLPISAQLRFRVCAYELESRRPCASAFNLSCAARYDMYRFAAALGEYHSLNCADLHCAAVDIARNARCGHCTIDSTCSAGRLRAVYLPAHVPPGLGSTPNVPSRTSSRPIATATSALPEARTALAIASRAGVTAAMAPGGLAHARFARGTALRYAPCSLKAAGGAGAARFTAYRPA